ncbi:MAG: autoinducer binding domain-containing protein [Rhodobacteraceae bacterium]|nr:autoinducer binding domain-containing protein [Paracoccaceae bacterium]
MTPLLDHLEQILEPTTIEEVWALHIQKMAEYGFDRLFYGFTRFRTSHSYGNTDDLLILSNHHQSYLDEYVQKGLYYHAPMVSWAANNVGACSWQLIREMVDSGAMTDTERRIVELNNRYEISSGYAISFRDLSVRSKGAIGLCARVGLDQDAVDQIWSVHGREILLINNITHLRITSLPFATPRRSLTARQREALEWVGEGKTMQDIATIMGLTPATIEKHLRLAREALEVETTAQAVLKASFQNQIFIAPA